MMSGLLLWHRAAEDRLVLLVHHWPSPVATVQHITMPGACSELGTTTSPATPRVCSPVLCSPGGVALRRKLEQYERERDEDEHYDHWEDGDLWAL